MLWKVWIDLFLDVVGFYCRLEHIKFLGDLSGRFIVLLNDDIRARCGWNREGWSVAGNRSDPIPRATCRAGLGIRHSSRNAFEHLNSVDLSIPLIDDRNIYSSVG